MNWADITELLSEPERQWICGLSAREIANVLSTVYKRLNIQPERSAVSLGQTGEFTFRQIGDILPVGYSLLDTTKVGHAGDFIIRYTTESTVYQILVDIKNYKTTIPKKEITKFRDDLTYGMYDGGLLISTGGKFVGVSQDVYMDREYLPHGSVPVLYLVGVPPALLVHYIQVVALSAVAVRHRMCDMDKVNIALSFITESLNQSANTRRLLLDLQNSICQQITKCQETLLTHEIQIKTAIKSLQHTVAPSTVVTGSSPLVTSRDPPVASRDPPVASRDPPVASRDPPVASRDPPVAGRSPPAGQILSTSLTRNRIVLDYAITPIPPRPDNLEDERCEPTPDLPQQVVQINIPEFSNTFDCDAYHPDDRPVVMALVDLNWETIEQNDNGSAIFRSPVITLQMAPLKTKTRIRFDPSNTLPTLLTELTPYCTTSKKYVMDLTPDIIAILERFLQPDA